jgi:hypothetical protein
MDRNPQIIRIARIATDERDQIDFAVADLLRFRPTAPVDLIVSTLLAHHLADRAIVDLLGWMERTARRGWFVCDLQRHPLPDALIGLAGKLANLHPTIIADGQISVTRALTCSNGRRASTRPAPASRRDGPLVPVPLPNRTVAMISVDIAVLGDGPAGAATACALAAAGREVLLLERAAAPRHKVCSEFLSVETEACLMRLSIDLRALGAPPVDRLSLWSRPAAAPRRR